MSGSKKNYNNVASLLQRKEATINISIKAFGKLNDPVKNANAKNVDKKESERLMSTIYAKAQMVKDEIKECDIVFFKKLAKKLKKTLGWESIVYYGCCSIEEYNVTSFDLITFRLTAPLHCRPYLTYEYITFASVFLLFVKFQFTSK